LLEERLGPGRVEVLNLGINGTASDHWLSRLDELYGLEPDVVVQYEFVNDFFWNHILQLDAERPWYRRRNASLLVAWLVPVPAEAFDPYFPDTVRNLRAMARAASERGAAHVAATFAGPDAERASPEFRNYLDWITERWGASVRLRSFAEYDAARRRFNDLLRQVAPRRELRLAPVAEELTDPALFVDLCHLTQPGIEQMARAFLPAVVDALETPGRLQPR
jgi:hypothetical protein